MYLGADFQSYFDHLRSRMGAIPEQHVEPLPTYEDTSNGAVPGSSSDSAVPAYQPFAAPSYVASSSAPKEESPSYDRPPPS